MKQCAGRNDRNDRTERRRVRTVRIAERRKRRGSGENRQTARRRSGTERCGEYLFCRRQEESYGQQSLHGLTPGETGKPGKRETAPFRIRPAVRRIEEGAYQEPYGDDNGKYAGSRESAARERIGYADPCNGRMTEESLRQFERHLRQEGKKASTVEKYLRDVKAFWFWLRETEKESKESAEEECGGGEERRGADPASDTGGGQCGTDVVCGAGGGGYGADVFSVIREREDGNDVAFGAGGSRSETDVASGGGESRSETGVVSGTGERDERPVHEAGEASEAVTKAKAWRWRDFLCEKGYAPVTVNAMLTALNLFFRFLGREDCRVKTLRIQRKFFRSSERELCRREYEQLVRAAKGKGKERLALLIEAMGATGIRVSEVKYITAEAVRQGRAEIALKGKIRTILIPDQLRKKLRQYAGEKGISSGEIFITKSGKGLSRQQIWAEMKRLCPSAGILKTKVFPHNLRHLFARAFYRVCRDIVKLADVLGHSHIATTRIYLTSTGEEHARHLERLHLVSRM